ncbi:MAG: bifunctional pyr operon transcriptional regulator/uracil phosphoribosyltransferase [Hydrogenophilales bacterium 28-61-23]|nr:MAG: bifunctional pyr operon transcriptional regulator/uracil phosphoribosyltransferase [Hydrogenophilales bacterium 28-61-23]
MSPQPNLPTHLPALTPEQLIDRLAEQIKPHIESNLHADCALVGIHTGGVWIMDALAERFRVVGTPDIPRGVLDIAFYRDDFSRIGLHPETKPSHLPFDVEGRHILLIDDVLYTGRTIRAAMNLLFDYGRPATIKLAVLVDRGGRELPVCADYVGLKLELPADQHISLEKSEAEGLHFIMKRKP